MKRQKGLSLAEHDLIATQLKMMHDMTCRIMCKVGNGYGKTDPKTRIAVKAHHCVVFLRNRLENQMFQDCWNNPNPVHSPYYPHWEHSYAEFDPRDIFGDDGPRPLGAQAKES